MSTTITKGSLVYFGRTYGEKTLGRVLRVNPRSITVEQLEERGTLRGYRVGTKWRVAPSFVALAPEGTQAPALQGAPRGV